jgi:hypothetical protein
VGKPVNLSLEVNARLSNNYVYTYGLCRTFVGYALGLRSSETLVVWSLLFYDELFAIFKVSSR